MVGYIQQQSPQHWHAAINGWIAALVGQHCSDGCIWRNADQLQSLNVTDEIGLSECLSSHERTGNCVTPCVTIYHFWVYMSHPSEREAWLYENAEALGKVRRGLKQARAKKFAADPPDLHAAAELAQDLVDV
jgi:hypothetical protein